MAKPNKDTIFSMVAKGLGITPGLWPKGYTGAKMAPVSLGLLGAGLGKLIGMATSDEDETEKEKRHRSNMSALKWALLGAGGGFLGLTLPTAAGVAALVKKMGKKPSFGGLGDLYTTTGPFKEAPYNVDTGEVANQIEDSIKEEGGVSPTNLKKAPSQEADFGPGESHRTLQMARASGIRALRNLWGDRLGAALIALGINQVRHKLRGSTDFVGKLPPVKDPMLQEAINTLPFAAFNPAPTAAAALTSSTIRRALSEIARIGTFSLQENLHNAAYRRWRGDFKPSKYDDMYSPKDPLITGPHFRPFSSTLIPWEDIAAIPIEKGSGYKKSAGLLDSLNVPVGESLGLIQSDPVLSPVEKAVAMSVIQDANNNRLKGLVSTRQLVGAAVDAGLGSLAGRVLGEVFSLPPRKKRKLSRLGLLGGLLANTGVLRA